MNKQIAIKLLDKAKEVAERFSSFDREKNFNKETFKFEQIKPLSDYSAGVLFRKSTGKKAIAFFYYIESGDGYWCYFFPKDSHIVGMEKFNDIKVALEEFNFEKNFERE